MNPSTTRPQPANFHTILDAPPFALAEFCLALFCAWLVFAFSGLGGWPLLLALLPMLVRLAGKRTASPSNRLVPWLVLFMLAAAVGVWASYDPAAAWQRFWVLLAGVVICLSLAGQPAENLEPVAAILGGVSTLLAVYFLLTHNWASAPADIGLLNRVALGWMGIRPRLDWTWLHPNQVGGIIAVFAPLQLWSLFRAIRERSWMMSSLLLGGGLVAATGLLFSSSRAAWLVLAAALGTWLVIEIDTTRRWRWLRSGLALALLAAVILLAAGGGLSIQSIAGLVGSLPGPDSSISRLEIYANTLRLVRDVPFTGGGLGAFTAHYSEYVLLIPVLFFTYAHNLYLDLAFNLGLPGLVLYMVILLYTFRRVLARPGTAGLRGALLASLLVMTTHGLVDDAFFGHSPTPFLFVLPGLAAAFAAASPRPNQPAAFNRPMLRGGLAMGLGLVLLLGAWGRGPLLSAWHTGLGTVAMARAGLPGFPTAGWDESSDPAKYRQAQAEFELALQADPETIGAHYRLGLIAMQRRDFPAACGELQAALDLDPAHRGVIKALGYCRAWLGDPETAARLLASIPEARREMGAYSGWWQQQGRPDLAEMAGRVQAKLLSNP